MTPPDVDTQRRARSDTQIWTFAAARTSAPLLCALLVSMVAALGLGGCDGGGEQTASAPPSGGSQTVTGAGSSFAA
ncbi:hypothetical protein, partial [Thiohalocapsa halophila]